MLLSEKMAHKFHSLVSDDMGSDDGALIIDESGFVKKGKKSVVVARHYCATSGKVDNCQAGVSAAYVSEHGYSIVDKRLFVPEKWLGDEYRGKRKKCKMPEDGVFKTKPRSASEMLIDFYSEWSISARMPRKRNICLTLQAGRKLLPRRDGDE